MTTPGMANTPTTELLVIAASSGENLKLAQRFADQTRALVQTVERRDLYAVALRSFTRRAQ